jgi:hypothetical protein
MFINSPGQAGQSVSFLNILNAAGAPAGSPDDAIFPTAAQGTFYVADTGANGLVPNTSLYADVGNAFNSVNMTSGVVTPIFTGVSPHGMDFVVTTPEPGALSLCVIGLLFWFMRSRRRRGELKSIG